MLTANQTLLTPSVVITQPTGTVLTAAPQDSSWNIYSVSFEADCMNGNEPGTTSPVRPSGERGELGPSTANTPITTTSWLWSELDKRESIVQTL